MQTVTLLVDDRERAVIPFLEVQSNKFTLVEFIKMHLTRGDYAIMCDNRVLVSIERKTWADLADSIKDNRIANMDKMLELRELTGCTLVLLIEGDSALGGRVSARKSKMHGIHLGNLRAYLDHMSLKRNVHVMYAQDPKGVAFRLFELAVNSMKCYTQGELQLKIGSQEDSNLESVCQGRDLELLRQKQPLKEEEQRILMWIALPGVALMTARVLIAANIKLREFISGNLDRDAISQLKVGNTLIGRHTNRLLRWQKSSKAPSILQKLLVQIKGVSKVCASRILEKYPKLDFDVESLAKVQKTDKMKIGIKLAKYIDQCLQF